MVVNGSILVPKSSKIFMCNICNYNTSRKSQYDRHLSTLKHKNKENGSKMVVNDSNLVPKSSVPYMCLCGKSYKYDSGFYRHKKTCKKVPLEDRFDYENTDNELIMMLIKQNTDLMELLKNGTNNVTNTNCMNNNKTFNLQFFLNETCKNAMNISEFIENIKIQLSDIERLGEVGYIEGLSNIITSNLKVMDVTERPVHCTDKKRETIYIKDDNKWEKEDDNKTRLRKAIKRISSKNYKLLPAYREKYPGCQYSESKHSDKYNKMMIEIYGGEGDNDLEKENKIIKNIAKNIIIDK